MGSTGVSHSSTSNSRAARLGTCCSRSPCRKSTPAPKFSLWVCKKHISPSSARNKSCSLLTIQSLRTGKTIFHYWPNGMSFCRKHVTLLWWHTESEMSLARGQRTSPSRYMMQQDIHVCVQVFCEKCEKLPRTSVPVKFSLQQGCFTKHWVLKYSSRIYVRQTVSNQKLIST